MNALYFDLIENKMMTLVSDSLVLVYLKSKIRGCISATSRGWLQATGQRQQVRKKEAEQSRSIAKLQQTVSEQLSQENHVFLGFVPRSIQQLHCSELCTTLLWHCF